MPTDTSTATVDLARFDADEKPRRDNYFGTDDGDDDELSGHRTKTTLDISQHKAHKFIKEASELLCGRQRHVEPWNGGRTAEQIAWLEADVDVEQLPDIEAAIDTSQLIDGRGDQLHREKRSVALSPARYYPPAEGLADRTSPGKSRYHAARINPETGYLNYNLSTWSETQDLDWETLRYAILCYAAEEQLAERKREFLVREAKSRKLNPNNSMSDEDILFDVLEQMKREFSQQ